MPASRPAKRFRWLGIGLAGIVAIALFSIIGFVLGIPAESDIPTIDPPPSQQAEEAEPAPSKNQERESLGDGGVTTIIDDVKVRVNIETPEDSDEPEDDQGASKRRKRSRSRAKPPRTPAQDKRLIRELSPLR
jgi:hypothetical protein